METKRKREEEYCGTFMPKWSVERLRSWREKVISGGDFGTAVPKESWDG
jgi:hypothetical protein